jgi:AcrR family transcriptional regulator
MTPAKPPEASKPAQIMAAARRLFLKAGYGATSMDAVARAANVSKATLYAHFTSKADLFAEMVGGECARAVPTLADPGFDLVPVSDALYRLGRRFLDLVLSPEALAVFRLVIAETPRFPELGRAFYQAGPERTLAALAGYLDRASQRGELVIADPHAAAELLWGMIRARAHLRCLLGVDPPPSPAERDAHVRRAIDLFLKGCGR